MHLNRTILACAATILFPAFALAGFNGQMLTADWYVPDNVTILESYNFTVGPTVELPVGSITSGPTFSIDAADSEIRFDFVQHAIFTPVTVNGFKFTDTNNTIPPIINVKLGPMSPGITNLSLSDITFSSDSFFVNLTAVDAPGNGDFFTFEVQFGPDTPEPASAMLGAVGLIALARRRARRR